MAGNAIDVFGELLMCKVRDKAIADWDRILDGRMKGRTAERVREELATASPDAADVLRNMVPRLVDSVLDHLMWTLEQEETIDVSVEVDGVTTPSIRDASDGLSGELYGERGWISRFSQERPGDSVD